MLKAIIFDMDGVICDSEPLHMKAFQQVLTEEGIVITDQEYYDKYLSHDDRGSFEAVFQVHGRPSPDAMQMKTLLARKARLFDELMKDGLVIYPGVDSFMKKAGVRYSLALASGARRLEVEFVLKKAKIRDAFAAIVSADEVKNGKPQPEAFERALALLNQMRLDGTPEIKATEILVIEDSPRCIETAKKLSMKTVGMATSYKADDLRQADLVIDTLVGFELEALEKLFSTATVDIEVLNAKFKLPAPVAEPLRRSWTEAEAFAYCSRLTHSHYENFPVGSVLIPRKLQPAIHSLYAFMRTADDFSDEDRRAGDEAERMAWLNAWDAMLTACERGDTHHPVFVALRVTLNQYRLPVEWLRDLLHAFKMDVTIRRYSSYDDLLAYCRCSANPVGRLILTLFGYRDDELYRLSDAVCTGLQLANHWQDVGVDLEKDRIYLPQGDLKRYGCTEEDLKRHVYDDRFRRLMDFEVSRARALFASGRSLPERVRGRLRWELRFTWQGGVRILDKIEAVEYDVFKRRPVVSRADWFAILPRVLFSHG